MKSITKLMALVIAAVTMVACANTDLNPVTPEEPQGNPYAINPCLKFGGTVDEVRQHIAASGEPWVCESPDSLQYWDEMGTWYDVYHDGDNRLWYFYETGDGQNMLYLIYEYCDGLLSPDGMHAELLRMGYTYLGRLEYPWLPDDQYTMYLSADGQSEAQITILPDATWEVSFQPTDPTDYDYLVTD